MLAAIRTMIPGKPVKKTQEKFVISLKCMSPLIYIKAIIAEPERWRPRGAPLLGKFGNLSIREILVVTSASVRPYRLWGRGTGVARQADRGCRMPSFLGGKSRGAFGQPALAGNRMTTVTFEKEVCKSFGCLAKRFSSTEVKFRT